MAFKNLQGSGKIICIMVEFYKNSETLPEHWRYIEQPAMRAIPKNISIEYITRVGSDYISMRDHL